MDLDGKFLAGQFAYSRWATVKTLDACAGVGREELTRQLYTSYGSLYGTLAHIFQADGVWLARLLGNPVAKQPDPPLDASMEALRSVWLPVCDQLEEFAAGLSEARLLEPLPFRSWSRGDCQMPIWQILLHVVNHATYHRGQITTMLRQLGHTPVSTDMLFYWLDQRQSPPR